MFQLILALTIFLVLLGIKESNGFFSTQVREGLRYALTTEWNYQPVMDRVVQYGLQTVSVDLPFFDTLPAGVVAGDDKDKDKDKDQVVEVIQPENNVPALPVSGSLDRAYGWVTDDSSGLERFHTGIDITAPEGTPVRAVFDGKVARIGRDDSYGLYVLITHSGARSSLYAHLGEVQVAEGDEVKAGAIIGRVGLEGDFEGWGLHFEFREREELVDPLNVFNLTTEEKS
ncbi:MAG: M23 family metallopeptidase [Peptococcaceae bacterium]|nr:M23 family metallopeptidase [Peptococcaceae bacterium]